MGSTYLQLTNKLLRRVREVEMQDTEFASARNVHGLAKDAVKDAVDKINKHKFEWPFNAVEHRQTLVQGVQEYAWPVNFKVVDWNSFQLQKNEELNIQHRKLKYINRDDWYKYLRDEDEDTGLEGKGSPRYVFESHGNGFGLSPSPNAEYEIEFRYYRNPDPLIDFDDVTSIPSEFDFVIIAAALYHMNLFRENPDGVMIAKEEFKEGLANMETLLINKYHTMSSTQVQFGGGSRYNPSYGISKI